MTEYDYPDCYENLDHYLGDIMEHMFFPNTFGRATINFGVTGYDEFLDWYIDRYPVSEHVEKKLREDKELKDCFELKIACVKEDA